MRKPKTKDYISKLYWALKDYNAKVEKEIEDYFTENIDFVQLNIKEKFVTGKEKEEQKLIEENSPCAIRFFKPYVNDNAIDIAKGNIPNFLKQDIESYKAEVDSYDNLPKDEDKLKLEEKLYKELAIVFARYVNILNRRKQSERRGIDTTYSAKHLYIARFIRFAMAYNKMVNPKQRFEMGILKDDEGKYVLNASIPGFTRLSVHMGGSYKNTCGILEKVENDNQKNNQKKIFPRNEKGSIDLEKVISNNNFSYSLPDFGINNTAIINKACTDEAKVYIKHMEEIKTKSDFQSQLEIFINLQCSDFNDRELYFLAEKAGYMKGHFKVLTEEIKKRSIDKENRESFYIKRKFEECEGDKNKQQNLINDLYHKYVDDYFSIANINKDIKKYMDRNGKFVEILKDQSILDDSLSKQINKNISEFISTTIENTINDGVFFDSFMMPNNNKDSDLCCMNLDVFKGICEYGEFKDRFRFFANYFTEMELNEKKEKEKNKTKMEEILRSTDDENKINSNLYRLVQKFKSEEISEEEFLGRFNNLYKTYYQSMESKVDSPADLKDTFEDLGISQKRNRQIHAW